ncbi:hypothetical protein [Lysinibacillus agricola]|uniref:hypothetical protein n=1 Tax=Lysinibacillus agricola TaxID=2590012 RepID=UPI003C1343A9
MFVESALPEWNVQLRTYFDEEPEKNIKKSPTVFSKRLVSVVNVTLLNKFYSIKK